MAIRVNCMLVARKSGNKWYVAGINGEDVAKTLTLDLSFLKNKKANLTFSSGDAAGDEATFGQRTLAVPSSGKVDISLKKNDGFVAVFE